MWLQLLTEQVGYQFFSVHTRFHLLSELMHFYPVEVKGCTKLYLDEEAREGGGSVSYVSYSWQPNVLYSWAEIGTQLLV